jgi:hypothetical protein
MTVPMVSPPKVQVIGQHSLQQKVSSYQPSPRLVTRALNVLWWLYLYQGHTKPRPRPRQWRPGGAFLRGVTADLLLKQPGAGKGTVNLIIAWRDYLIQREG